MGEVPLGKFEEHPEYNFLTRLPNGDTVWVLSVSGVFRACYLPTGLLDWRPLTAHPDPPPPGRIRLYFLGTDLYRDDGTGPVLIGGGGGVSNFLALLDTPASYAGQAGMHVAVNLAEDALEFVAAGSGGAAPSHHFSYPAIYYPRRISFLGENFTGFVHWPGWSAMDEHFPNPTANTLNAFLTFGVNAWGRETDATSGRRVTYARGVGNLEENTNYDFSLYRAIPGDFDSWDAEGITVSHRIVFSPGAPAPGETTTITAEVFAPNNPADVVVASATRVVTGATDAGYVDLVIPEAALTAAGFVPGDMLRLRVRSSAGGGFVSNEAHHRLSRIHTSWRLLGGGGGAGAGVDVLDEGILQAGGPFDAIDFIGDGVDAVPSATPGRVEVTIPGGGAAPDYIEDETVSSQTSIVLSQKLRLNFVSPADGTLYMIGWQAEVRNEDGTVPTRVVVELDDDGADPIAQVWPPSEEKFKLFYMPVGGFRRMTADAGAHFVDIDYASGEIGKESFIRRARIKATRIS